MTDCTLDASLNTEIGFRYPGMDEAVLQDSALLANRSFLEFVGRVHCFMESFESLNRLAELISGIVIARMQCEVQLRCKQQAQHSANALQDWPQVSRLHGLLLPVLL